MQSSLLSLVATSSTGFIAVASLYMMYQAYEQKTRAPLKMYGLLAVGHLCLAAAFGYSYISFLTPFRAFPVFGIGVVLIFGAFTVKRNEIDG